MLAMGLASRLLNCSFCDFWGYRVVGKPCGYSSDGASLRRDGKRRSWSPQQRGFNGVDQVCRRVFAMLSRGEIGDIVESRPIWFWLRGGAGGVSMKN